MLLRESFESPSSFFEACSNTPRRILEKTSNVELLAGSKATPQDHPSRPRNSDASPECHFGTFSKERRRSIEGISKEDGHTARGFFTKRGHVTNPESRGFSLVVAQKPASATEC